MLRVLYFLVVVFVVGFGFAWLADRPGQMVVNFGGYRYEFSIMVAAVLALVLVAAVMLLWWLARSIWNSPYYVSRYFRVRRRDRGYQALSTGMIAAGAGDGAMARRMKQQAAKLIDADREPLVHLLDAQAALLEGDHETARARFEAMLDDPELRLLGLRGLYLEAEQAGERAAAHHYAGRAADIAPQLAWAADATIERRAQDGDWQGALRLLDAQKSSRQVGRESIARRRAVILTAQAQSLMDQDPTAARTAATEANKLAPDLVPAAVAAAKASFRLNDLRRGAKILEAAWKVEPHPEVAEAYIHARPGDSTHDRLARAEKLRTLRPHNVESSMAMARAALEAGELATARSEIEAAIRMAPREGAFLLLADIEEADGADEGRIRQWLSRAVRAPRDPAWIADGQMSPHWGPFSPVSGRLDAFEWRAPPERPTALLDYDEADFARPEVLISSPKPALVEEAELVEDETVADAQPAPAAAPAAMPEPAAPPAEAAPARPELRPAQVPNRGDAPAPVASHRTGSTPRPGPIRPPDDPGVDPQDEQVRSAGGGFRLF